MSLIVTRCCTKVITNTQGANMSPLIKCNLTCACNQVITSKWASNYANGRAKAITFQHIIWFKYGSADIIRTKPIPVEIAVGLNRFFLQRANIGWILEVSQERLSLRNWLTRTMHFVWDIDVEKLPHFKIWSRFWKGSMKLFRPNDHIWRDKKQLIWR